VITAQTGNKRKADGRKAKMGKYDCGRLGVRILLALAIFGMIVPNGSAETGKSAEIPDRNVKVKDET
jgi:hypothetical protein